MILVFIQIKESLLFAINSLRSNRVRTILSLLGITIGIFVIISVFTMVDSLEKQIRQSIESLGSNVIYIQKWPWEFGSDYAWWKYMKRPLPTIAEMDELARRTEKADAVGFIASTQKTVQYLDKSIDNISLVGASYEYDKIRSFEIEKGRYFSSLEAGRGYNKAIIGSVLANALFGKQNPIGKTLKVGGNKVNIIGVFKKEGDDMFGNSSDNTVLIPINYARNFLDLRSDMLNPFIMVKAPNGMNVEELSDELHGLMRAIRKLHPMEDDDFALNRSSMIAQGMEDLFKIIHIAGFVIGGFSMLVGGFGIANIMFVSVRERTRLIGIQKALGAKRYVILLQFLYEAVILALIGGAIGLTLIFLGTLLANFYLDLGISLSVKNILMGLGISAIIGILSGFFPAFAAARLDPVKAISSN